MPEETLALKLPSFPFTGTLRPNSKISTSAPRIGIVLSDARLSPAAFSAPLPSVSFPVLCISLSAFSSNVAGNSGATCV